MDVFFLSALFSSLSTVLYLTSAPCPLSLNAPPSHAFVFPALSPQQRRHRHYSARQCDILCRLTAGVSDQHGQRHGRTAQTEQMTNENNLAAQQEAVTPGGKNAPKPGGAEGGDAEQAQGAPGTPQTDEQAAGNKKEDL